MTAAPPPSAMPLVGGLVLLVGTGFVDAYTFLAHGHVFAEAMTGNLVLTGVGVVDPTVVPFWRPLATFGAFVAGVTVEWLARRRLPGRVPQVATLAVLVVVLGVAGALPSSVPDVAVSCAIALAAGMQIAAFDHIGSAKFTSTVMTSNSRTTVASVLTAVSSRARADALLAARLVGALLAFVVGVVVGAVVTQAWAGRAGWVAAALFVVAGALYLAADPAPRKPLAPVR
ncbi:YoaK family protein [Jatrophihabitans sp. YIM 134969]